MENPSLTKANTQIPSHRLPTLTLRTTWVSRIPFLLAFIPAIVAILHLKSVMRKAEDQFGFEFSKLSFLDKLAIFRADILLCFLVIPLGLFVLTLVFPRRLRGPCVALFSIGSLIISYANVQIISQVGRLYSLNLLRDSVHWAWNDPRTIREYVKPGGVIRVLILVVLTAAITWWASTQSAACLKQTSTRRRWVRATQAVALPLAVVVVLPWLSGYPFLSGTSTQSAVISTIRAFWGWDEEQSKEFQRLSDAELIAKYRELAHIEISNKDPRYWAKANGSDVIVFVFETGAAKFLPIDGNLDDFPNLRILRDRAFVASKH